MDAERKLKHWTKYPNPFYVRTAQAFTRALAQGLGFALYRPVITSSFPSDTKLPRPLIIAANHQSVLDPFLIGAFLPYIPYSRLHPLRFMTGNGFLEQRIIGRLGWLVGCFPAKKAANVSYGIERAEQVLAGGGAVTIFPEGKRTIERQTAARSGIALLAEFPEAWILPVRLRWYKKNGKRRLYIRYGMPYQPNGMTAQQMLDDIYTLPLGMSGAE